MKRALTIITLSFFLAVSVLANSRLDALVSRGNRAYLHGQSDEVKCCIDSISLILNKEGVSHEAYTDYMISLLKLQGDYNWLRASHNKDALYEAERCFLKADSLSQNSVAVALPIQTPILLSRELAQVYYRMENFEEAQKCLRTAIQREEEIDCYGIGSPDWILMHLSHALTLARLGHYASAIEEAESALSEAIDESDISYARALRMVAKIKMLAQKDAIGATNAYRSFFQSEKEYAFANFAEMNPRQREEYWLMLRPFFVDCYRLEDADASLLYDVALFSKGLLLQLSRLSGNGVATEAAIRSISYTWQDIQSRLSSDEVAVEFVEYEKNGINEIGALVLHAHGVPQFVKISPFNEIPLRLQNDMNSTSRRGKNRLYSDTKLQEIIWAPKLLNAIGEARRIYFAPEGYLHNLAIEYMPQVEDRELYRLSSTRRLMEPSNFDKNDAMLICGGMLFGSGDQSDTVDDNDYDAFNQYQGKTFRDLESAECEVKEIYRLRANKLDLLLTGTEATEERFRQEAHSYPMILIASHGDFHSDEMACVPACDIAVSADEKVMSHNILVFSGANTRLKTDLSEAANHYDGILSARELGYLDLSGCKLVALSACQSGRGVISPEGVFGLQRGLKNAGADAILVSLWNVNDRAATFLMQDFYRNISEGMDICNAFREARATLIEHDEAPDIEGLPKVNILKNPQYRNAFILIDALPAK